MINEVQQFRIAVDQGQPYSNSRLVEVKSAVDMLVMLDLYVNEFEDSYMKITNEFYVQVAAQKLEIHKPADYVLYVQELIQTETKLSSMYLSDAHTS